MEPEFWHDRWRHNRIGFHQDAVSPMLAAHWEAVGAARDARVFVPLAGKSLDMAWLAARGHSILGIELSPIAVRDFFASQRLVPRVYASRHGQHHVAGAYELVVGDAFALDAAALAGCGAVYDRAALIALPPGMRSAYLHDLYAALPAGCRGLLVTLEYPQTEKAGPPFSVGEAEVRAGLQQHWEIARLARRDILADDGGAVGAGLSALHTVAYRVHKSA